MEGLIKGFIAIICFTSIALMAATSLILMDRVECQQRNPKPTFLACEKIGRTGEVVKAPRQP